MSDNFFPQLQDSNNVDLPLYVGDGANPVITFTHQDTSGAVVDITTWDIRCIGKVNLDDTDANAVFAEITATVTDGTNGIFTVDFTTLNLTEIQRDLHLIFRRVVSAKKQVKAIYLTNVVKGGVTT